MRYKPYSISSSEPMSWLQSTKNPPKSVPIPLSVILIAIVDVGTGSGRWVVEVADDYPTAHVVGIDLSPIQPTDVPSNAEFILMDLSQGLDFETGSTDLVQSRYPCPLTSQF
jgi:tRNA G46 methylase TrmB